MNRRLRKTLASALCLIAVGASVPLAHAAPKDADALKLDKQAMDDDYLNVRFDAAEKKLRDALNLCGATGCTPKIKAQIYMHLGIIQVNAGKAADATAAFTEGLKLDPTAAPETDFSSDAVRKAYDAAKASAPAPTTTGTPPATGTGTAPTPPTPSGENDLKHEVITEGQVSIPVPVYVGAQDGVTRVVLFYKAPGADFVKIEMKRVGRGFGVEIPCKDVKIAGPVRYYIQALDAQGDVVGSAGSKKQPIEFALKQKVSGELPAFPGKEPPAKCSGQGDCPPGMKQAGCEEKLSYGSKCTGPGQCNAGDGLACIDGTCQPGKEDSSEGPVVDDGGNQLPPAKLNLLSIGVSLDDAIVNGSNICSLGNASDGTYVCFRQDSGRLYSQFNSGANTGSISGPPFAVGTVRILLGYDRAIPIRGAAITPAIGVRIGYAFNGGKGVPQGSSEDSPGHTTKLPNNGDTKDFMPFHLEGRVTGFFGKNVLARRGVRPFAFVGGGLAQVDAKISDVQVKADCSTNGTTPPAACLQGERNSTNGATRVDAYRKMGTGFVGLGGGILYAISPTSSLGVDVKVSLFFGSPGVAISPTLGFVQQL